MPNTSDHIPPAVGRPALRAFEAAGYARLSQFAGVREGDLLALHGVGPKSIRILREALSAKGLSFADPKAKG